MKCCLRIASLLLLATPAVWAADPPQPLVTGMKNPESVCIGANGLTYVTEIGEFGKDGDGLVSVIKDGKAVPFATGLDDPKGIITFDNVFFVTDKTRVVKIDAEGKVTTLSAPANFPTPPLFLNDITFRPGEGTIFVSDSGNLMGKDGAVYSINHKTGEAKLVVNAERLAGLHTPNGLAMDGESHLLLADFGSGILHRIKLADNTSEKIADGFEGGDGLAWDHYGGLFITSWKTGRVSGIPRPGQKPILLSEKFEQAADCCLAPDGRHILIPDMKAGTLTAFPTTIPGWEVDESELPVALEPAFPNLKWTGWEPVNDAGLVQPFWPILLTNAGDGSNRIFVPEQHGVIHVFANDDAAAETKIFLDIRDRVRYNDKQNEEGFLGLAFHPQYKKNGEFFVFYTDVKAKLVNVVSRFRVSKTDPNKADPASEEVLLRIEKPFWNHDGGTLAFGPDGYLYVTHGDGGAGNDPHENGQKMSTLLGKVLRIDVDHKANGKNYAIPKDNPFVGQKDVLPEIWAYGLRNVWRMGFDRKTGTLWAGEVGQNLFEEINILKAGGNYGWNLREALHPFGAKGVDVRKNLIDPIWEYHHDVGHSITGGFVYRGKKVPELEGAYLYGDYTSLRIWALRYDEAKGRVVANHPIKSVGVQVVSFGEDENGEVYMTTSSQNGKGLFRFAKASAAK